MAGYAFKLPFNFDQGYREAERDFAWPLYVMNEYVRVTNDLEYHRKVGGHLVHHVTQWWQSPQPHKFKGEVIGINDASKGTGYWTMTRMDNHDGTDSNGTNPWMAGPLLSSLATYLEEDKYIGSSVKHDDIEEMLLQTMNYIVKYGWAGSDEEGGFCYSEVICSKGGLSGQIVYPLMYTNNLYQQRVLDGELQNLHWYDTQYKWEQTIYRHKVHYRDMSASANSTALGWYGYEFPFPMQSMRMLEELQ